MSTNFCNMTALIPFIYYSPPPPLNGLIVSQSKNKYSHTLALLWLYKKTNLSQTPFQGSKLTSRKMKLINI